MDGIGSRAFDEFKVYPNPATGMVTFAYSITQAGGDVRIVVTNTLGEKVAEMNPGNNSGKTYWDASKQPAGVYFYMACNAKGIVSKGKVVVVR